MEHSRTIGVWTGHCPVSITRRLGKRVRFGAPHTGLRHAHRWHLAQVRQLRQTLCIEAVALPLRAEDHPQLLRVGQDHAPGQRRPLRHPPPVRLPFPRHSVRSACGSPFWKWVRTTPPSGGRAAFSNVRKCQDVIARSSHARSAATSARAGLLRSYRRAA